MARRLNYFEMLADDYLSGPKKRDDLSSLLSAVYYLGKDDMAQSIKAAGLLDMHGNAKSSLDEVRQRMKGE